MKECKKCNILKSLDKFYKHPQMKDGHINICKDCKKIQSKDNRLKNVEYYRKYDIKRGNRQKPEYIKKFREKYPNKYKAHNLVNNCIRDKKLFRMPCEKCGTEKNIHAHHDDYLKPLNIRWLCASHHSKWHLENGEGLNP